MLFSVIPAGRSKIKNKDFLIRIDPSEEEVIIELLAAMKIIILCDKECIGKPCFDNKNEICKEAKDLMQKHDSNPTLRNTCLADCLAGSLFFLGPGYSLELKQELIAV
ncbi:MAG: hypothetical protein KAI71_05965 [Candidatus Pacebacteria bacterium]|nr:hypothetical protein [Candidatus Paceibacterota bacterium]